jgi:hypothetical protein
MTNIYNDHNVYVFGAGFSRARGLPLIANFMFDLRDAHEWLLSQGRITEADSVQRVLQFRLHSAPASYRVQIDLENIEELFSLAAAIDSSLTGDICVAVAATLDYCAATHSVPITRYRLERDRVALPACLVNNVVHHGAAPSAIEVQAPTYQYLLAGLLGQLNTPRASVTNSLISFNYDTVIEDALTDLETPFSYGFGDRSVIVSAVRLALDNESPLRLLKLHGSTNWAYPGVRGGRLTIFDSYDSVRAAKFVPQLVPPTWRKSFDRPLTHIWQEALLQISRATRLVIIGFSMPPTDLHFKYLLGAGLRENISLRQIIFVNPNRESIEPRVRELFGDLSRRPTVEFLPINAHALTGQWEAIGRAQHSAIQSVWQG